MPLMLEIPDAVLEALRLPRAEIERELRAELALILYERGAVSMGKAAEMSQLTRGAFEDLLARRKVDRNYSAEDLQHDLEWSRAQGEPRPR